jgi:hypothetical protein
MNDAFREVAMPLPVGKQRGKSYIAVIGIDRYRGWQRLYNAVADAHGTLRSFARLGFEPACPPLLDDMATGDALRRLVADDLSTLGPEDSLVLFFAGHGHTTTRRYHGDSTVKDGYLIPVDGEPPRGRRGTWIRLDSWLADVARIQARHILVVLDACHSGLALGPIIKWRNRGNDDRIGEPFERLRTRSSRRIITSALDDQLAMDVGPVLGHSLFTGCLIEGLGGGIARYFGRTTVTGTEIAHYVQRRVCEYPDSHQTPDFGALELDDRGELIVSLAAATQRGVPPPPRSVAPPAAAAAPRPSTAAASPSAPPSAPSSPVTPPTDTPKPQAPPLIPAAAPSRRRSPWTMTAAAICAAGGVAAVLVRSSGDAPGSSSRAPAPPVVNAAPAPPGANPAPASPGSGAASNATRGDARDLAGTLAIANPFVGAGGLRVQAHQVTRREYALYLETLPQQHRARAIPLRGWDDTDPEAPVSWTRFEQAAAFCAACGARLATHAEWVRASGGAWGLDPTGSGRPGPLREWTSDRQGDWVRVAGATAIMTPAKRAAALDDVLLFATEARPTRGALEDVDLASKEVGIRCVLDK